MGILAGKRAIITGAGSGIGLAIAKKYCEEGASVLITGRNEEKLKKAGMETGRPIQYMVWDVRDRKSVV